MTRWLVLCALGIGACTTTEGAEARYGPLKGDSLVSLAGTISDSSIHVTGAPTIRSTALTTRVGYGYFLTPNHELGANLGYRLEDNNVANSDYSQLDLTALYNYNIRASSRTWYYAGIDLGFRRIDDEAAEKFTDLLYGIHVGLRNWLTPQIAFFAEPFYQRSKFELPIDDSADQDQFGILFGLQYAF